MSEFGIVLPLKAEIVVYQLVLSYPVQGWSALVILLMKFGKQFPAA